MNNLNKIFSYVFIIIFIIVFSYYNFSEYKYFHKYKIELKQNELKLETKLKEFSLKKIKTINGIQLYYTPDK